MHVVLTPDLEAIVQRKIESGLFRDPSEVVRAALISMEDQEQRLAYLRAAVAKAEEQIRRGEVVEWTPDLRAQLRKEAAELARRGVKPNPDVCP